MNRSLFFVSYSPARGQSNDVEGYVFLDDDGESEIRSALSGALRAGLVCAFRITRQFAESALVGGPKEILAPLRDIRDARVAELRSVDLLVKPVAHV